MKKILVIQTAFIGDVILATALLEKLHRHFPKAAIDILVRKGNETLFEGHPFIHEVLIWEKKQAKYKGLFSLIPQIRNKHYDLVVNLQRFFSTGFLTVFAGANKTVGFNKNPWSLCFSKSCPHQFGDGTHEVARNLSLIAEWTDNQFVKPKLYPSAEDFRIIPIHQAYITISPASVWFTKQFPAAKWIELIEKVGEELSIFLLGGKGDLELCNSIKRYFTEKKIVVLAGQLTFLQSAALMKNARMNFVNDSAPLHLASAVNAPVTAVFCSTIPAFGFTPLSENSALVETEFPLDCRPCGLHGKPACPKGHFKCSDIAVERLLAKLG
ncbi:MAG: glycosyltransferase family 9 protein [Saprospiraceae bacterium]